MEGAESSGRDGEKKSPFDSMDRDQLVKKCKGLLGIAQMAKKTKDELSAENSHLKEIVSQYEIKTTADKECMKAMKEMVDSLTEYKLTAANQIADSGRHCDALKIKLRDFEQMSIENEGMKRQIARLTDENDEQALDLKQLDEKLEKVNQLSQKQNDELIILEQSVNRWKEMEVSYKRLQEEHSNLEEQCRKDRAAFAELEGLRSENKECKNAHNEMTLLHEKTMEDFERVSKEMHELQGKLAGIGGDGDASVRLEQALNENAYLKEDLGAKTEDLDKLKCRLERLAEEFVALKKSRDLLVESATTNNRWMDECKNSFQSCSAELLERIAHLENTNAKLEAELEQNANGYEQEKSYLRNKYKEIEFKYNDLQKISDDVKTAGKAKEQKLEADANEHIQQLQRENVSISGSLKTLTKQERELCSKTVQLQMSLDERIQIDQVHSELTAARFHTDEHAELVQKLQQIEIDLNRHKAEIKELATDLIIKQGKCDSLELQCKELVNKHQAELSEARELNEALKNRNTSLSQELEILKKTEDELEDLRIELQTKSDKILKAATKEQDLLAQNQKLAEQFKTLESAECSSCNDLKVDVGMKTTEIEQHREELKRIQVANENQLKSCNDVINEMNDANEALKNRIMSLEQELDITKSMDHEEGAKFQRLLEQKQGEIDSLNAQLKENKEEIKGMKSESGALEAKLRDLNTNLEKANDDRNDQVENLEKQNNEIKGKHDKLLGELEFLKNAKCVDCDRLSKEMSTIRADSENIKKLLSDRLSEIEAIKVKLAERQNENVKQVEQIEALEQAKNAIQIEYNTQQATLNSLQNTPCNKCDELRANISEIQAEMQALKDHSSALETQLTEKSTEFDKVQQEQAEKEATVTIIQENDKQKLNELLAELDSLRNAACTQCASLQQQIDAANTESEQIKAASVESESAVQAKIDRIQELEKNDEQMKQKNDELLTEMREINEALKNRGDVISKQNREISDLQGSLEKSANRLGELEDEVKQKMAAVEKLTSSVRDYEMRANDSFGDNQSEILSTSTISRAEDFARMRDIEDSFEEKYNKLRGLAMKLKKKVQEQNATIAKLEADSAKNSDSGNLKIQNLKALQGEHDQLMDKIDKITEENSKLKKSEAQLKDEMEKSVSELTVLKGKLEDTQSLADTHSKSKSALDQALQDAAKKNKALKGDADKLASSKKSLEEEINKLKEQIKAKDSEIKSHKTEINKIKSTVKKTNVLNLEMEASEKSLKDVSQKFETNKMRVTELESANKSMENTVDAQKNEIKILEEGMRSEKQHSVELKQEVDMQQIKIKESEHEKFELKLKIEEFTKENNSLKLEIADVRQELSQYTVDKEKLITTLQSESEKNIRQLFAFEDEIRNLKTRLNESEQELVNIKTEYASYKVRAQSVLRQNQTKDSSNEDELKEELSSARKSNENLTAKLTAASDQIRQLQNVVSEANNDKDHLKGRCKELLQLLDESRRQVETIQEESRKQMQENNEALKMQRVQIDTLNSCYQSQIVELEAKHAQEVLILKAAIKETDTRNQSALEKTRGHHHHHQHTHLTDEQRIDLILTERQDGEGSESAGSIQGAVQRKLSTARGTRELIPLDELLNMPFDDNDNEVFAVDRPESPTTALKNTRDKLNMQETRVKHLATLLSEAELDVARLTQLNDVLKEEVRRQERSTEREKHMHNLEYIKNIIFKFLTINNADERAHLVPVLNTILKLSPEEANQLQTVARGGETSQRGWSNILPMW